MQWLAKIKRGSQIDRLWKDGRRVSGGTISGVAFRKVGGDFVSDILSADQVAKLGSNPSVVLEVVGVLPEPTPEPAAPPIESATSAPARSIAPLEIPAAAAPRIEPPLPAVTPPPVARKKPGPKPGSTRKPKV